MEYPWKMWFKERKGVKVGFSYAFDENFYLSLTLDKFSSNVSVGEWLILE